MTITEALRIALRGLLANRLRSALTMFGVMIGVAAVILMVAAGNGTSAFVTEQFESIPSNMIRVAPGNQPGVSQGFGSAQSLTEDDVEALSDRSKAPNITAVLPSTNGEGILRYEDEKWRSPIIGSTEQFAPLFNLDLAVGSFFTEADVRASAKVVVLGQTSVDELFGGDPAAALGQRVKIDRQTFQVIGVFEPQGSGLFGDQDNVAVVPINTAWNYLVGGTGRGGGGRNIDELFVQADSTDRASVEATVDRIKEILLENRGFEDESDADFQAQSLQSFLGTITAITGGLTIALGAIAAISLVVGGIGVMNIMLVTVTERTREIGIRKAIGAKRRAILLQFLIEAIFLSGVGGLLGVGIGVGLAKAAAAAALKAGENFPVPTVSGSSIVLALSVSFGIGLFFGVYPANRAAKLKPIEALRYE